MNFKKILFYIFFNDFQIIFFQNIFFRIYKMYFGKRR